jgi:hypothetical protein
VCLDCNGFQHGQRRECGGVKPERPNWHRVRGGKFPRNLPFASRCGAIANYRGDGGCRSGAIASAGAQRKWSEPRCCTRDGPRGVRGLGARGPSRKTNAVLRTRFPVSQKKIGDRGTAVAKVLRSSFLCLEVRTPTGADGSCGPTAEKKQARSPRVARARSPGLAEERKRTKVSLRLPNTPSPSELCVPQ